MADNDDLMLEVTGSSDKAASALDKVIAKLSELQGTFDKLTPTLSKFTAKMDSIASSSKALSALKGLTEGTNRTALSAKNAESKMALYQARIDRANTSMERSRVQSEKLSSALKKVSEAEQIAAHNNAAFSMPASEFANKFNTNKNSEGVNLTPEQPGETYTPTPAGHTKLASEILPNEGNASVHINTAQAQSALSEVQAYIDRLTPSISHMSSEAQAKFNSLASTLSRVSQQIDNQRAIYHQLSSAATQAASATGEGGSAYLRLEKRMLSTDSAIDRLIAKQEELKSQMADIPSVAENASIAMTKLGNSAEKASSKSSSGLSKTLGMMEKMFVRIAAFKIYSAVAQALQEGIQNIAQASGQANATMSALATSSLYLKNSIASALMPIIQAVTPLITWLCNQLANLFNMIGMIGARLFGGATTVTIAKSAQVNYAESLNKTANNAKKASDKIKELQRTVMGFDELNQLSKPTSSSGATSGVGNSGMPSPSSMFETVKIPSNIANIADTIKGILAKIRSYIPQSAFDNWNHAISKLKSTWDEFSKSIHGSGVLEFFERLAGFVAGFVINEFSDLIFTLSGLLEVFTGINEHDPKKVINGVKDALLGLVSIPIDFFTGLIDFVFGTHFNAQWQNMKKQIESFNLGQWLADRVNDIKNFFDTANKKWADFFNSIKLGWNAFMNFFQKSLPEWWNGNIAPWFSEAKWQGLGENIKKGISDKWTSLVSWWNSSGPVKWWSSSVSPWFTQKKWQGLGENIKQGLSSKWSSFTSWWGSLGPVKWWNTNVAPWFTLSKWQGLGKSAVDGLLAPFKSIHWPKISTPHIEWTSGGWQSTGWIKDTLSALHLPTQLPKLNVKWYANGGLFNAPTIAGIGEAGPEAALPLNDKVFSQIAQGIVRNGGSSSDSEMRSQIGEISEQIAALKEAILNRPVKLYADDREIAESANRGNHTINKRYHNIIPV